MGIYLGQLPPAEIARLKAELAETLVAHFCYPRFFDNRTEELRMRPVDRAKRQEVWLFLSSVDFTSWGRVDLMSPDFQHQIERLFIQFVQRNRAFFGDQGRKRMSDVRMLINSSASSVVQGLRNHLTGQRQGAPAFGSPRPAVSWSQSVIADYVEPSWEQIASTTMLLQQQLQELRGEVRPGASNGDARPATSATRRPQPQSQPQQSRPQVGSPGVANGFVGHDEVATVQTPASAPPVNIPTPSGKRPAAMSPGTPVNPARKLDQPTTSPLKPTDAPAISAIPSLADQAHGTLPPSPTMRGGSSSPSPAMKSGPLATPPTRASGSLPPLSARTSGPLPSSETMQPFVAPAPSTSSAPPQQRGLSQTSLPVSSAVAANPREASMMTIGEDDMAIFEQMRHQLLVWLRVEAIRAGLDVSNQAPAQLLDMLRQHAHFDETRLQVVSTLLNLSNQIVKTGVVSLLDYKQALMFHLMHTRY